MDAGAAEGPVVGLCAKRFHRCLGDPSATRKNSILDATSLRLRRLARIRAYVDSCAIDAPRVLSGWGRSAIDVRIRFPVAQACHSSATA